MFSRETHSQESKLAKKERNGLVYALFWEISFVFVAIFKRLKVSPNQVTVLGFILAVGSGACFAYGQYALNVLGAVCFFLSMICDCADGKLARELNKTSNLGIWLDYNFDYIKYLFVYPPLVMAVFRETGDPRFIVYGFIILTTILTYVIVTQRFGEFPFAQGETKAMTTGWRHQIAKQFYAYDLIEAVLLLIFALIGALDWFLLVWAAYFSMFYLATTVVFGKSIQKYDAQFRKKT